MWKICLSCCVLFFLLPSCFLSGQLNTSAVATVPLKEEREKFLHQLKNISFDPSVLNSISWLVATEVDSIRLFIISNNSKPDSEKAKALKSLIYFLRDLNKNIDERKIEVYGIPEALRSYRKLLEAVLHHTSVNEVLASLSPRRARLLANAFWQYDVSELLRDIAIYKLIASSPERCIQFLKAKPNFRFADSLLFIAAAYDPSKTSSYLIQYKDQFRNDATKNIYLQEIISVAENKLASELMPFIVPLAEKRITTDEILATRLNVTGYFQLLVNTLRNEWAKQSESTFILNSILRNAIKQKSLAFYVNSINDLHSSPDNIRFASVKDLRPEDLYYVITSCEDELYTSSYLGLYRRLMDQLKDRPADSLFQIVQYDNFRTFMRMAANYNTLADFLTRMPPANAAALLRRFISGIEQNMDTGLEKAMDVADAFTGISNNEMIRDFITDELKYNFIRCQMNKSYFGMRLYTILIQIFNLVKKEDPDNKLWKQLGNYELLERKAIQNKNNEIIELVLFYGDEDGTASFNNFLTLFKDTSAWKISKNNFSVTIRSTSDQPVVIYANLPLDTKQELDVQAQDSLTNYLAQRSIEPTILIHRGHSYHLPKTLKKMQPSVRLALLGSCGGYNSILSVANINPDAQIIVTKKTGSKLINDPIIEEINETLLQGKDLVWADVWAELQNRFQKDEFTLNLFNEYLPPGKNLSLFVLKLFNNYQ